MVHGSVKRILHLIEALAISVVVVAALAAWRLAQGPVNLDFLNPYIQEALTATDGSFRVEVDHTLLTWAGWERALDLRATGVRAISGEKGVVAAVPELSLSLSGSALTKGVVAPRTLEVFGPRIRLFRDPDGALHWGVALGDDDAEQEPADLVVRRLYRELVQAPDPASPTGHLARIRLLDAELVVEDAVLGLTWVARDADLLLMRHDNGLFADIHLAVDLGGELTDVDARISHRTVDGDFKVEVEFNNLRPEVLAGMNPAWRDLAAVELPLGGLLKGQFDLDSGLQKASFDIGGGSGRLNLPDPIDTEYPVFGLHLRGEVEAQPRRLTVHDLFIDIGGPTVTANAVIEQEPDGGLILKAHAGTYNVPTDVVPHYWPQKLAPKPRKWVVANLTDGIVDHANVTAAVRRTAKGEVIIDRLDGEILPRGVTVNYLRPMPPVRNVGARIRYDHTSFTIGANGGELLGLRVTGGSLLFTALDTNDEQATLDLKIEGPLTDALAVLDSKPLGYTSKLGISPKSAKGHSVTNLHLAFPLISWLGLDDIEVLATSELQEVSLPKVLMGMDLSRGELKLTVNTQGMDVVGPVKLGSMAAQLAWRENFGTKVDVRSRYKLQGTVDDAQRRELGLDTVPFVAPWITGPVKADVDVAMKGAGTGSIAARLDLADAAMELPGMGWRKPPGAAGKAQVEVRLVKERLVDIPRFKVEARDLVTEGSVAFEAGKARAVTFGRLHYGRTDLAGMLTLRGDAGLDIAVRGASFDAKPVLAGEPEPAKPQRPGAAADKTDELPPMTITAHLDKLWLGDKAALGKVDLSLTRDGKEWRTARLDARLDGSGKPVTLTMQPADGRRSFSAVSDDAGGVFHALDIFDNMRGGKLQVHGTVQGSGRDEVIAGKAEVADYKVVNAPALAQLLSVAALTGIGDLLRGEGLSFLTLEAPFTLHDGLLRLNEAVAAGVELGLTCKGEIDVRHDRMALEGTIVPMYAVNSMLGNIPLLGALLTDAKGGGVFAATFTMKGANDDPQVMVNPLAALTPGVLRRFFSLFGGGVGEARHRDGSAPAPTIGLQPVRPEQ